MKRRMVIFIAVFIAICLCTGVVVAKTIYLDFSQQDLTEQDIELKTQIAKISDTKVDFRHYKQETFENKKYDISFKEFNSEDSAVRKVVYTNDLGDEFKYDIETGNLVEADIDSNIVVKTADSIDIDTAHKIMLEHLPKDCDINKYTCSTYKEKDNGYRFSYTRYIGKYFTSESFNMTIAYNGAIIDFWDSTNSINWKNLEIDEEYIDTKIQEYARQNGITKIKGYDVCMYQGKVCVWCSYGDEYTSVTAVSLE